VKSAIGVLLVGCGAWGRNLLRHLRSNPGVRVRAAVEARFANRLRTIVGQGFLRFAVDYQDALADPRVQAVVITLPNHRHRDFAVAALEAGKHVFVEKPLANSLQEAAEVENAWRRAGTVLMVGHNMSYEAVVIGAREVLERGDLGTLRSVRLERSLPRNYEDWRADPGTCRGGVLSQLGIHLLDLLLHVTGELPGNVRVASSSWSRNLEEVEWTGMCSGAMVRCIASYRRSAGFHVCFAGEDGSLEIHDGEAYLNGVAIDCSHRDTIDAVFASFVEAIRNNAPFVNDAAHAMQLMQAVEDILARCTTEGRTVDV